jgi:hypothetical protein
MVQELEARDTPSGVADLMTQPDGDAPVAGDARRLPGNAAPVISDFRAIVGPNGQVTFTGTVTDDQAVAGYVVRITGNGIDTSAIVQRDGSFSVTTFATGPGDITVSATTTDALGATSDPARTMFTPSSRSD